MKKRYKTIDVKNNTSISIELEPNKKINNCKDGIKSLFTLLAVANDIDDLPRIKKLMIYEALRQNEVTNDEALTAIWKAYGDPYLPAGQIEFRHLMKYIAESRKKEDVTYYTYEQVLNMMDKDNLPQSAFKITDKAKNGKKLWVKL